VTVAPPTETETFEILEGVKERYEQFHKVRYSSEAIKTAVYQSNRYITDRFFPDKALDLLDEAGAKVKLKRVADTQNLRKLETEIKQIVKEMKKAISDKDFEKAVFLREREIELKEEIERVKASSSERPEASQEVTRRDIEEIISSWTGIPVSSLQMEEAEKLLHMEDALRIAKAIRRSRLGVNNPNRPMGSFIFLGPSGVGKTEVARRLAEFLFENQKSLVRFDMSEFMEKHAVSKLIGSPPGYVGHEEGGQLTEKIRRNPYSVILLDEIEKAHPDIANLLLQILEDGILTDAYGNVVDFKNTLIIMTSNIGTRHLVNQTRMGFGDAKEPRTHREIEDLVLKELRRDFSPEFINRIDDVIVFHPLSHEELQRVCRLLIDDVNEALRYKNVTVEIDDEAIEWLLARAGEDPHMGARPLRRAIQKYVEDRISESLIVDREEKISSFSVSVEGDELSVAARDKETVSQVD
jgi:ATP-dependent Clp protease ATP-binding subunit ClpC